MSTKQVIVMRRDLKMRRGKEISQGGHSVLAFLTRKLQPAYEGKGGADDNHLLHEVMLTRDEVNWIGNSYKKVTCQVKSEAELLEVVEKAKTAGLTVHLITDSGKTEFNGVATNTCCAIGPHSDEKFEGITSGLELY